MQNFAFLLVFLPTLALGADHKLVKCEGVPLPKEVNIAECPDGSPCNFHVGQSVTVSFTIHLDKPVTSIPYRIWSVTLDDLVQRDVPTQHKNVCEEIDGGCPLQPGDHTFTDTFDLKHFPASQDVIFGGIFNDQDNNAIACFTHKAKFLEN